MLKKTISGLSVCLFATIVFAACGQAVETTADVATPEDTGDCPFSAVPSPDDPCKILTCGADGSAIFVPVEVGTSCASNDCCLGTTTTCQPCATDDDTCLSSGLICTGPASTQCPDDGNTCTEAAAVCADDECTCRYDPVPNDTECKAGNQACTEGDTCQDGVCVEGLLLDLEDMELFPQYDKLCADLVCVKGEVDVKFLEGNCNDGNPCSEGDKCGLGQCVAGSGVECPVESCHSSNACNPETGACEPEIIADGAECELNNECITLATCTAGVCKAKTTIECDDGDPCTIDTCHPEAEVGEQCKNEPIDDGETNTGPLPDPFGVHSYPPSGGSFSNWGGGEAFASRITLPSEKLPYTIGAVRSVLPTGKTWLPAIWSDQGGMPGNKISSGLGVVGQGGTELQDAPLSGSHTLTTSVPTIWAGFEAGGGGQFDPNGAILFDSDGAQTMNYIYGAYVDFNDLNNICQIPCWRPATDHAPSAQDWVVEIGPAQPSCE